MSGTATFNSYRNLQKRRKRRTKQKMAEWLPTNGADLSGHDFGCEQVWLSFKMADGKFHVSESPRRPSAVSFWNIYTHYMLTDIKTPEPPGR